MACGTCRQVRGTIPRVCMCVLRDGTDGVGIGFRVRVFACVCRYSCRRPGLEAVGVVMCTVPTKSAMYFSSFFFSPITVTVVCPTGPHLPL